MLSDIWFTLVTLSCVAWMSWNLISNRRKAAQPPLPPGPMGLPVIGMLPFIGPQLHTYFTRLALTYGPLMSLRLGQKIVVVVSSPLVAKQLLKDNDVTFSNHDTTEAGREFTHGGNDVPFIPYGPKWRNLRKLSVNGLLGSTALNTAGNLRTQVINTTIIYMQEHLGCEVNFGEQMFVMVLNVITNMLWGSTMKGKNMAMEGDEFRMVVSRIFELAGSPNVSDLIPKLARFDLKNIAKNMRECTQRVDLTLDAVLETRRQMDTKKNGEKCDVDDSQDFLQFIKRLTSLGDQKTPMTDEQIKGLFTGKIVGGTHTTTNTLEFAMAEMVNNPTVLRKAQQELETVVGVGNQVEESHTQHLLYLHAIMKETLRLHPVFPLLVPRCPSETCIVGGYTIPKGSAVFFNMWAIHRDPSHWEDPLEFKPERFLGRKHDFNGNNFNYLPFGSGRRICAGIEMAERMIMFSLASLLHYFEWNLPEGVDEVDLSETFGFALQKATPLMLIPSARSSE